MRATTLFCLSMALFLTGNAQQRFIAADYTRYFDWFHEHAQTELFYTHQASLFIFEYQTPLMQEPCNDSKVLDYLSIGQEVTNLTASSLKNALQEDQIKGYDDLWYPVRTISSRGEPIQGYVWGAHLAKGWRHFDLEQDGQSEFIMLGVSSRPRTTPENIQAEIRILQGAQLLAQVQVPGLCVFEECASSVLLRIIPDQPQAGRQIIETSTLTIGCEVSIEKNYFYWDGVQLKRVMHGELAFQPFQEMDPFISEQKLKEDGQYEIIECTYLGEDPDFLPIWKCEKIMSNKKEPAYKDSKVKVK
jgi:hypothetical protein